jgi:hypothetical protein
MHLQTKQKHLYERVAMYIKKGDKSEKASITFVRCEPRREWFGVWSWACHSGIVIFYLLWCPLWSMEQIGNTISSLTRGSCGRIIVELTSTYVISVYHCYCLRVRTNISNYYEHTIWLLNSASHVLLEDTCYWTLNSSKKKLTNATDRFLFTNTNAHLVLKEPSGSMS